MTANQATSSPGYFTLLFVAQVSNLLYRGFPTRRPLKAANGLPTGKSATQQASGRRYNHLLNPPEPSVKYAGSVTSSVPGESLLLVDGHAHAYRAFHAIRELNGPDGQPTNAIFGFRKALEKLRSNLQPTHLAVIWDGGLAAVRTDVLPDYKANRPPMPDALAGQLDQIVEWLDAEGVTSLRAAGVEADDWIATQAQAAAADGAEVRISSSDKDFMQLVTDLVRLVNPGDRAGGELGPAGVEAKTGVRPDQIVDWLSLIGDSVDNIPGVPGVGRKTATALLRQFGSCEGLYADLAAVNPERIRRALEAARDVVRRNQELIRLAPPAVECRPLADLAPRPPDQERLADLYRRWGFRSALEALEPAQQELL